MKRLKPLAVGGLLIVFAACALAAASAYQGLWYLIPIQVACVIAGGRLAWRHS